MEKLIEDIEAYAAARGIKPTTVLQRGAGLGGLVWARWKAGSATCSFKTADRLRSWMQENPPKDVAA